MKDLYYDQRKINELIPDIKGEKNENPNTEWFYFDNEKDTLLYSRLDFTNPISHCLKLDPLSSHRRTDEKTYDSSVRLRDQRLKDAKVTKYLDDINDLLPNTPIGTVACLNKQFILDVNDDKYYLYASSLKPFARAIEEKLEYTLRINGTQTQIFANEKIEKKLLPLGKQKKNINWKNKVFQL